MALHGYSRKGMCGRVSRGHGHPRRVRARDAKCPSHARGNTSSGGRRTPRRRRIKHKGGPHVASEPLVHQAGLLQHSGIGSAKVRSLRSSKQHEQLRDDAAHPGSGIGVVSSPAGSFRAGRTHGFRRGDTPRSILGSRVAAEALVLLRLRQVEEALRRRNRGMSVNDRGLERPLIRKQAIPHDDEALQLPAALVRRPLSPQDEGKGGGRRRGQRHPQLADAPGEHVLPVQDDVILRQATEGIEPVLQLIQGGVSRGPDRRGRATNDGIVIPRTSTVLTLRAVELRATRP